jgi:hypothetical protein
VLRSVSNDGNQDQTNKRTADSRSSDEIVDTVNQIVGADSDQDGSDNQNGDGGDRGLLMFVLGIIVFGLVLGIEQVAVCTELENEIKNVKQKQNDSGTTGQGKNALGLLLGATLVQNSIELQELVRSWNGILQTYSSWDDKRGRRQSHERASCLGSS